MKRLGLPRSLGLRLGAILALALLPALSGCTGGQSTLGRVLSHLTSEETPLSEEAQIQFDRFKTVFKAYSAEPENKERLDYFGFAFRRVRTSYVSYISDATLIDAAIKGVRDTKAKAGSLPPKELVEKALDSMMQSLDPHSVYLNGEEFHETFVKTRGEFGGLGIEITMEEGLVKVIAPIEGTPADRGGLKAGDLISHVDGEPIQGKTIQEAVRLMRGRPGSQLTLMIKRKENPDFLVTLIRAVIKIKAVRWHLEDDIAYVRVSRFTEKVEPGIYKAFADIDKKLGARLAGIVLDLRNNGGGLLDQSLVLADSFMDKGEIVSIRGRNPDRNRSQRARPGDLGHGAPMVVLINSGSASASEIVASALQYHKRAVMMGTRSFGKGSVQTILPMPVEGGLKLTTALYYSPSGQTIQARGVEPDIVLTPPAKDKDTKYKREKDLPGSLPAVAPKKGDKSVNAGVHPEVPEEACPEIGEKKDRQLGCALTYLQAGSTKNFLAMMQSRPRS
ncbi:MAG: S41 family peptidase [Rhodospirillales bacterium]|nr:S41 family peptidase [Rhodospirillales bacterium]